MLHEFLASNRQTLISRCQEKAADRFKPLQSSSTVDHGVPLFLGQLVETLRSEQSRHPRNTADSEPTPAQTDIGRAAALHGADMLRQGSTVDQVVHDYGDVCQCVTTLAGELHATISIEEFRTLNRCLDNAIADAVASFGSAKHASIEQQAQTSQQRLIVFAAEHRRLIDIAVKSLAAIKTGNIGIGGATGALLSHALEELCALTERTLPEIHLSP